MKIGIKITTYNHAMREARNCKGISQKELSELVGVNITAIGQIERIIHPQIKAVKIPEILNRIAFELNCSLSDIFPDEYIQAITKGKLKHIESGFSFVIEHAIGIDPPLTINQIEATIDNGTLSDLLSEQMEILTPRENRVLKMRYGLLGEQNHTLKQIAKVLGITPERVRQIESKALRRLRHPERCRKLREYL